MFPPPPSFLERVWHYGSAEGRGVQPTGEGRAGVTASLHPQGQEEGEEKQAVLPHQEGTR